MNRILVRIWDTVRWIGRRAGLLIAVLVGIGIGYLVFLGLAPDPGSASTSPAKTSEDQGEEAVTIWTCSMHPEVRLPKPGLCPKCRMKLIEVRTTAGDKMSGLRQFTASKDAKALMDIETAVVERKFVTAEIRMVGKVDYDETRLAYITAWIPGRLDKLFVDFTGVQVNKGDHMVYLYSPELLSAQEELLQAHQALKNLENSDIEIIRETAQATVEAVRGKLRLWGLTAEQISGIEKRGEVLDHMTIYAPVAGTVIHRNAQEGMYVNTGTRIYTLADLSQVWVKLDAYESDLMWLRYGQKVQFTTVSYPGEIFTGTISFIDPILNPMTRTVKIRVNVPNVQGKLKPEMFAKAVVRAQVAAGGRVMEPDLAGKWICPMHPSIIKDSADNCDICKMPLVPTESLGYVSVDPAEMDKPLVIPVSAAMVTGTRAIVYVQIDPSLLQPESVVDWSALLLEVKKHTAGPTSTPGGFLNRRCPIKGTALDLERVPEDLTRSYRGRKIAFCCPGCPEQWDNLTDAEKQAKLSEAAAGERAVKRFWTALSPELGRELLATPPSEAPPVKLQHRFARQVNDLLNTQILGDAELWQAKELPSEARELVALGPEKLPPAKRTRLNRLLLESLFPGVLAKANAGPAYEGREIVLGPRAGNYYIVRSGLKDGDRIVTKGNFKIDSALQIEAKPSMMTPEGGGAAGGHGGMKMKKPVKEGATAMPAMELPALFRQQLQTILSAALDVKKAVKNKDMTEIKTSFTGLGKAVQAVDIELLEGHPRMLWKETSMRLSNDATEGQAAKTLSEAQRVADSLAENIDYLRSKFGSVIKVISPQIDEPAGGHVHE